MSEGVESSRSKECPSCGFLVDNRTARENGVYGGAGFDENFDFCLMRKRPVVRWQHNQCPHWINSKEIDARYLLSV